MLEGNDITVKEIWLAASRYLGSKLQRATYDHWFKPIVPVSRRNDTIILGVSDDFFADWLKENYSDLLREAIRATAGKDLAIEFEFGHVPGEQESAEPVKSVKPTTAAAGETGGCARLTVTEEKNIKSCTANLLPRYTLDKFVVGEENRYAFAAASTASKSPGSYNPLYI